MKHVWTLAAVTAAALAGRAPADALCARRPAAGRSRTDGTSDAAMYAAVTS